jgi:superfamily II DNA or RNA helicase
MYVNNRSDSRLRQLLSLFPYEHPRPIQSAALDAVARMFDSDKRFSILEAPTGAGKSALAFTAARYAGILAVHLVVQRIETIIGRFFALSCNAACNF